MTYADAAGSTAQRPAASAKPVKRKAVALARMAHYLATDETPTLASFYTALHSSWTKEYPDAAFPAINIVWLHHSKSFRVEFKSELEFLDAVALEYTWGVLSFSLEPTIPPYLSVRFQGVCPIWQVSPESITAALAPYGDTLKGTCHLGRETVQVVNGRGATITEGSNNGTIYAIMKPNVGVSKLPSHLTIRLNDGQHMTVRVSAIQTFHPSYRAGDKARQPLASTPTRRPPPSKAPAPVQLATVPEDRPAAAPPMAEPPTTSPPSSLPACPAEHHQAAQAEARQASPAEALPQDPPAESQPDTTNTPLAAQRPAPYPPRQIQLPDTSPETSPTLVLDITDDEWELPVRDASPKAPNEPSKAAPDTNETNDPSPAYTRSKKEKLRKKNKNRVDEFYQEQRTESICAYSGPTTAQDYFGGGGGYT